VPGYARQQVVQIPLPPLPAGVRVRQHLAGADGI